MAIKAQPIVGVMRYVEPKTGTFTGPGVQALTQQVQAINSIPISVSGEQAAGAGMEWTLANAPAGNVLLYGETADGPIPLSAGSGKPWNYTIDGARITTHQNFLGVTACYEYLQS